MVGLRNHSFALLAGLLAAATWLSAAETPDVEKLTAATLVSFTHQDAYADAVIDEFVRQTGYGLAIQKDPSGKLPNLPPVSLAIEKQPYWKALRELCDQANVGPLSPGMPGARLTLTPIRPPMRNIMQYPASINGAFMTIVTQLHRTNAVDLANLPKINRNVSLMLQVYAEPKVRIVMWSGYPHLDEAVDEKGHSLIPPEAIARSTRIAWSYGRIMGLVSVPLEYPDGAGDRIAALRGSIKAVVQTKGEKLEIADVMKAANLNQAVGGRRMTLKEIRKQNDWQYQATVVFYREGLDEQQYRELLINPGMSLVDDQGHEFTASLAWTGALGFAPGAATVVGNPALDAAARNESEVRITFSRQDRAAQGAAEPSKLIWNIVTESREITIPFEFRGLPLP